MSHPTIMLKQPPHGVWYAVVPGMSGPLCEYGGAVIAIRCDPYDALYMAYRYLRRKYKPQSQVLGKSRWDRERWRFPRRDRLYYLREDDSTPQRGFFHWQESDTASYAKKMRGHT